jgi:hypothetical protein
VLVVPNRIVSIYSRIWCVFEVFLAYRREKIIYTASAPLNGASWGILALQLVYSIMVSAVSRYAIQSLAHQGDLQISGHRPTICPSVISFFMFSLACLLILLSLLMTRHRRSINWVGSTVVGVLLGYLMHLIFEGVPVVSFLAYETLEMCSCWTGFLGLVFVLAEWDRRWDAEDERNRLQLQLGWTGMKDAGSSLPQDKAAILSEIQAHSQEEQVNEAVEVLILAGMSTPSLRLAAARGAGCIRGAGQWRSTAVAIPFAVWVLTPLSHIVLDISCGGALRWVPWLQAGQGLTWIILFLLARTDQKGFISRVAFVLGNFPLFVIWTIWIAWHLGGLSATSRLHCVPDAFHCFLLGPLMLGLSVAGIEATAGIPMIGPMLLRLIFPAGHKQENSISNKRNDIEDPEPAIPDP